MNFDVFGIVVVEEAKHINDFLLTYDVVYLLHKWPELLYPHSLLVGNSCLPEHLLSVHVFLMKEVLHALNVSFRPFSVLNYHTALVGHSSSHFINELFHRDRT